MSEFKSTKFLQEPEDPIFPPLQRHTDSCWSVPDSDMTLLMKRPRSRDYGSSPEERESHRRANFAWRTAYERQFRRLRRQLSEDIPHGEPHAVVDLAAPSQSLPYRSSFADQCRTLGLRVGDIIEGREESGDWWGVARLKIIFFGEKVGVVRHIQRVSGKPEWSMEEEKSNFTLNARDWKLLKF